MTSMADVAAAVVAELNGHTFSRTFTAVRSYRPVYPREEMAALHMTVVPAEVSRLVSDRGHQVKDFTVDVSVQHGPDPLDLAALDGLTAFVEELADYFFYRRLASLNRVICIHAAMAPGCERGYLEEHIETLMQFTGVLQLTLRVVE
jgi:hypothetical protein